MNNPYFFAFLLIMFLIFKSGQTGFGTASNSQGQGSNPTNQSIVTPAVNSPTVLDEYFTDSVDLKEIEAIAIVSISSLLFFLGFHTGFKNGTR